MAGARGVQPGLSAPIPTVPKRPAGAACPYCAVVLDPAPVRGRLCPRCRRPIVVRRVDGRLVLLTKEAVEVFEAEREREGNLRLWTSERRRWLALAKGVAAPAARMTRIAAAPPSEAGVAAARELYLAAAEKAVRAARRAKKWHELASIRHDQAAAVYEAAGCPIPPPEDAVKLHRESSSAVLRGLAKLGEQAELVSNGCCAICGRDNGKAFRIAVELRTHRIPHEGCPKGLCPGDWFVVPGAAPRVRRANRKASPGAAP